MSSSVNRILSSKRVTVLFIILFNIIVVCSAALTKTNRSSDEKSSVGFPEDEVEDPAQRNSMVSGKFIYNSFYYYVQSILIFESLISIVSWYMSK